MFTQQRRRVGVLCTCGAAFKGRSVHQVDCDVMRWGGLTSALEQHKQPGPNSLPLIAPDILTSIEEEYSAGLELADAMGGVLLNPLGVRIPRRSRRSKERPRSPCPDYKLTMQFFFSRPIDVAMWKHIKAPPGWRKGPVRATDARKYMGVRYSGRTSFRVTNMVGTYTRVRLTILDPLHPPTQEEVETIRATLLLIMEERFDGK